MSVFDMSASSGTVTVIAGRTATADLTVTNIGDRPSTGLISVVDRVHGEVPWLSFVHDAQRHFDVGASSVVRIAIQTTGLAITGESIVTVVVAAEHNPDEVFATVDLALRIEPQPEEPRRPWWYWPAIAGGGLVGLLLFIWLFSALRGSTTTVPNVLGQSYEQAAERLGDADLEPVLVPTTLADLDSPEFERRAPKLIDRLLVQRQRAVQAAADSDSDDDPATDDDASEPDLDKPIDDFTTTSSGSGDDAATASVVDAPATTIERLADRLVWQQIAESTMARGSRIPLKVVPKLVAVPAPPSIDLTSIMAHLADHGMRFQTADRPAENYLYGTDIQASFDPALPADLFEGTRVVIQRLPESFAVPDFTAVAVERLDEYRHCNLVYVYHATDSERQTTTSSAEVRQWADIQARHDLQPYVYKQAPETGTTVPLDDHTITVFIDTRRMGGG